MNERTNERNVVFNLGIDEIRIITIIMFSVGLFLIFGLMVLVARDIRILIIFKLIEWNSKLIFERTFLFCPSPFCHLAILINLSCKSEQKKKIVCFICCLMSCAICLAQYVCTSIHFLQTHFVLNISFISANCK